MDRISNFHVILYLYLLFSHRYPLNACLNISSFFNCWLRCIYPYPENTMKLFFFRWNFHTLETNPFLFNIPPTQHSRDPFTTFFCCCLYSIQFLTDVLLVCK